MYGWIEVDPGAPLPPEAPPWSERYEIVTRAGLSDEFRRRVRAAGAALLASGAAAALLMGTDGGFAHLFAAFAMLVGIGLYCGGLIEVPPSAKYVPSPGGRYVYVPPPPAADPEIEASSGWVRRGMGMVSTACMAVIGAILLLEWLQGDLTLHVIREWWPALAPMAPFLVGWGVNSVRRRLKSEAEVSNRFLQAADPRVPLAAPAASLPAGDPAPAKNE